MGGGRPRIPIWVNWRRRRLLAWFRDRLEVYYENLEYEAFPFRARETERARVLRTELEEARERAVRVVRASGVSSLDRQAPGEAGGSVVRVNVLEAVFELDRYTVPPGEALRTLDEARRAYEADRGRAWLRTLNPFYWTDRLMNVVERVPFVVLERAGISPDRAARSLPGRLLRSGLRLGVLAVVVGVLLWAAGWQDEVASILGRGIRRFRELIPYG